MAGCITAVAWSYGAKIYQPFNLVPFAGGSTGVQTAGWFNHEIKFFSGPERVKNAGCRGWAAKY